MAHNFADSPFTGLFSPGRKITGLIRMGAATDFTDPMIPFNGMIPGIGIKFLRSRTSSANFFVMKSLNPLEDNSHNFFQEILTNHLPSNITVPGNVKVAERNVQMDHLFKKKSSGGYIENEIGFFFHFEVSKIYVPRLKKRFFFIFLITL